MKYYPVLLQVARRPCLVIGGGPVAEQKVISLTKADAAVTVISPDLTPALQRLAAAGRVTHHARRYRTGDVRGFCLAYAATDDAALHGEITRDAAAAGVLLNVVDRPELCTFIVPSVVERGDLLIATSTSGASPALAKRIRTDLEAMFGPEYEVALQVLGRLRQQLAEQALERGERQRIFTALVDSPLVEYLRTRQAREVDRLLSETVGAGVSLASLGVELT